MSRGHESRCVMPTSTPCYIRTCSMKQPITIGESVELAIRHPQTASQLLARSFAELIRMQHWMDTATITRFFILFMNNLLDKSIEGSVDAALYAKVRTLPFTTGIKLLERSPEAGLKVLVTIVMEELRDKQQLPLHEQISFFNQLFELVFPEVDFSSVDLRKPAPGA